MPATPVKKNSSRDATQNGTPLYELRARGLGGGLLRLEIWQLPSPATPRLAEPELTASLHGRVLEIVETRVLRRLKRAGVQLPPLRKGDTDRIEVDEDTALELSLLFRTLAPMRSLDRIRMVSERLERLSREEAGYWMGMAVHRQSPRRVLAALRILLSAT